MVFLGTEPTEHVTEMQTPAPIAFRDVGATGVDRGSEIDDGRPSRHLRRNDLVGSGLAPRFPAMAAGDDEGRTVVCGEVHESDHRRDLELGMGAWHVNPDQLVTMKDLGFGPRTSVQDVRQVQLVPGATRSEHGITRSHQDRMGQDLGREYRGLACDSRDMARALAEEPGDGRVDERPIVIRPSMAKQRVELSVESAEKVRMKETFDDHCPGGIQCLHEVVERVFTGQAG